MRTRTRPNVESLEMRVSAASIQPTALEQLFFERVNDLRAAGASGRHLTAFAIEPTLKPIVLQIPRYQGNVSKIKGLIKANRVPWDSKYSVTYGMFGAGSSAVQGDPAQLTHFIEQQASFYMNVPMGNDPFAGHPGNKLYASHRILGLAIDESKSASTGSLTFIDLTAAPAGNKAILTGSIFRDANGNGKYDLAEGLPGVTVQVRGRPEHTADWTSGGYSLPLSVKKAMTITVTASGGGLTVPLTQQVVVRAGQNTRLNFVMPAE